MEEKRLKENPFFTVIFGTGYWLHSQGGIYIQVFKQGGSLFYLHLVLQMSCKPNGRRNALQELPLKAPSVHVGVT